MPSLFSDARMAAGYAAARPPVHPLVVERARPWLGGAPRRLVVDLGCGAGLSTRPLVPLGQCVVGIDPAPVMVAAASQVVKGARFAVGTAEALPLRAHSVDLLAAAGSLNYVDPGAAFDEAARVLGPDGALLAYDFSPGRTIRGTPTLDAWFEAFMRRYPPPRDNALPLDPSVLAGVSPRFRLAHATEFDVGLPLTRDAYTAYVLTETNVQDALTRGHHLDDVCAWVSASLAPVFGDDAREVRFRGYVALLRPWP